MLTLATHNTPIQLNSIELSCTMLFRETYPFMFSIGIIISEYVLSMVGGILEYGTQRYKGKTITIFVALCK